MNHHKKIKSSDSQYSLFERALKKCSELLAAQGYGEDDTVGDPEKYVKTGSIMHSVSTPSELLNNEFRQLVAILIIRHSRPDALGRSSARGLSEPEQAAMKKIHDKLLNLDFNLKDAEQREITESIHKGVNDMIAREILKHKAR